MQRVNFPVLCYKNNNLKKENTYTHLELLRKKFYIGPPRDQQAYKKGDTQEVCRTQPVKVSLLLPRKAMHCKNMRKENKMSS